MKRLIVTTIWILLLVLALAGAGAVGYGMYALKPVEAADEDVIVDIRSGWGSAQISKLLQTHGLVRDANVFLLYLKYKKEGSRFQAGQYALRPGMELDAIIAKLNAGETIKEETIRFTIPEGFTVRQIRERLTGLPGFDPDEFDRLTSSKQQWSNMKWLNGIPEDKPLAYPLEGYLFPETYELKKDSTTKDYVERMLTHLQDKLNQLPANWQDTMEAHGLTFHELMTIASLIEREVVVDDERSIVAGVIFNRIRTGMRLQIDATVQYALDKPKERLFENDLLVDSPYNTYAISGLPPGPIASPSLKSIEAALTPAETRYLYYVTKKDGTQGHYFAETYAQHLNNIAESKKR